MDNSTITTISIRNFKGIEDLQLNAKKLNAIIGKCGSGKSSLLDAIRFALTGKAGKDGSGNQNASGCYSSGTG